MKNKKEAIINKQNSKREQSVFTVEQISRELECFRKANEKIKQEYSRISVFGLVAGSGGDRRFCMAVNDSCRERKPSELFGTPDSGI